MNPLLGDPAVDLVSYERAMQICDGDKAALRVWRDEVRRDGN